MSRPGRHAAPAGGLTVHGWYAIRGVLTALVLAGLGLDAYVHLDLAGPYDSVASTMLSQGDLFRVEGAIAIAAALALLLRPRVYTMVIAFVVTLGGLGAVLIYLYVDVGAFGPVPDMYEPAWYPEKSQSAWGEGVGATAALALLVVAHLQARHSRTPPSTPP